MAVSTIKGAPLFLNTTVYGDLAKTFTFSNNYRGVMWIADSSPANCGEYMIYTTGGGVVGQKAISSASNVTLDTSVANKITIAPAAGSRVVEIHTLQGSVTT